MAEDAEELRRDGGRSGAGEKPRSDLRASIQSEVRTTLRRIIFRSFDLPDSVGMIMVVLVVVGVMAAMELPPWW